MIKKHILQKLKSVIIILLGLFLLVNVFGISIGAAETGENILENEDALPTVNINTYDLYAGAAVLMDAMTGRVLYEKNGYEQKAMASTTKIMTCLIALEYGNLNELVTVSAYAASMPNVKLGVRNGEQFLLKDLLYSLMLESHNDVAVAIAEHIAGSVEAFATLMNQKARDIGAYNTNFVTPNGLDAAEHYTTAADLALIGAYAIKNNKFVEITNTASYSFSNNAGTRSFSVNNKNSFLNQMDGAFGIKTGYTGQAGYCFVGALKRDGKVFISVVLGSGWPPNKTNKWSDTKKLMNYGLSNYSYEVIFSPREYEILEVAKGKKNSIATYIDEEICVLINSEKDVVDVKYVTAQKLEAPVKANQTVGFAEIYLNGELFRQVAIRTRDSVDKIDFRFCFNKVMRLCVP